MKHMIGCNYWGSKHGIDMWAKWDAESVRYDLKLLFDCGCRVLRVFPNWRDFQPLYPMKAWRGEFKEAYLHGEKRMDDNFGLDKNCVEHFHKFCGMCEEIGLELVVSILTGWMSGRQYNPPIVENLNLFKDPKALRWEERFVKGIVKNFKNEKSIVAWDLGNECNSLSGSVDNSDEAFMWSAFIANTIKSEDHTRPVMSGMHSLAPGVGGDSWLITDQAETTDILTTHPYYSPSIGATNSYPDEMRGCLLPTIQTQFYSDIGEKPAMMQEHGTFSSITMTEELAYRETKLNTLSGYFNGSKGMLFWCGFDFHDASQPPYEWTGMEVELGLYDKFYNPKREAIALNECRQLIETLGELPDKEYDVACHIGEAQESVFEFLDYAAPAFMLSKQAGLDVKFFGRTTRELPDAKVYVYPGIRSWSGTGCVSRQNKIMDKVRDGAILYISFEGGFMYNFEELTGLRSYGHSFRPHTIDCQYNGEKFSFKNVMLMRLKNDSAEVLCETDDHNVLFARKRHGKGWVYFNAIGMEKSIYKWDYDAFTAGDKSNYYKFYEAFMKDIAKEKPVLSQNKMVLTTHHKISDGEYIVSAINYSPVEQNPNLRIKDDMKYEMIHGDINKIPPNETIVLKVTEK